MVSGPDRRFLRLTEVATVAGVLAAAWVDSVVSMALAALAGVVVVVCQSWSRPIGSGHAPGGPSADVSAGIPQGHRRSRARLAGPVAP